MSTTITLNAAEQRLAKYVSNCRYEDSRKMGLTDCKFGPQSTYETDLEGIGGEIAFCKLFNVYPDLQTGDKTLSDHDCVVNGKRVDVKTSKYEDASLIGSFAKVGKNIDTFALMVGTFPTYRFAGAAPASKLLQPENIYDLGRGPCYVLNQSQLIVSRPQQEN